MLYRKISLREGLAIGNQKDFTPVLAALLQQLSPGTIIEFEPGDYHFWPDKAQPQDLYISNTDSRQYPSKKMGIVIEEKQDLHFKGRATETSRRHRKYVSE